MDNKKNKHAYESDVELDEKINDITDSSTLSTKDVSVTPKLSTSIPQQDHEVHIESCSESHDSPDEESKSCEKDSLPNVLSRSNEEEQIELCKTTIETEESSHELSVLLEINSKIDKLHEEFQHKIKYDSHKNRIIDELHREVQSYRSNLERTFLKPMVMNIIRAVDGIRKLSQYHHSNLDKLDVQKLLKQFDDIPHEFEDLLYTYGIEPFTCDEEIFNPKRQKVIKTFEVSDILLDKKVKDRIRPGYEWDENMIRPEMVTVYIYKASGEAEE